MRTLDFWQWSTCHESIDDMIAAGRYNPALELSYRLPAEQTYTVTIGSGSTDNVNCFSEGGRLYVVQANVPLEYIGIQVFEAGEEIGETFMDSGCGEEVAHLLKLRPINQAKRLADWIDL